MPSMFRFFDTPSDSSWLQSFDTPSIEKFYSLQQVLEPITARINQFDQIIQRATAECHFPSDHGLTLDESAAIYLYTMEWSDKSLYELMQGDLHSEDRCIAQSWSLYLTLFDTALRKLPPSRMKVWRGLNNDDTIRALTANDALIWWNVTSCSSSEQVIKDDLEQNFTMCCIDVIHGKDISKYSSYPHQKEIILCPATRLRVLSDDQDQTSSPTLHLSEKDEQMNSSVVNSNVKKASWRMLPLIPHLLVLIISLFLVTSLRKSWISEIDRTTMMEKESSNVHVHVDTRGNRYEGGWKDEKKHGKGQMDFSNGCKYTGDWVDDLITGEGIFIWSNGDRYEGQMENGHRHGRGVYTFANGDKYIGDWIYDKKEGDGVSTLAAGKYEGQFKDDKMHGKGSFYFPNGDAYTGDWIDDKQEGEGIFTWANGDRFEGGFKAGMLHGSGSYYFANGNKFTGDWVDGERATDHGSFTSINKGRSAIDSGKVEPADANSEVE